MTLSTYDGVNFLAVETWYTIVPLNNLVNPEPDGDHLTIKTYGVFDWWPDAYKHATRNRRPHEFAIGEIGLPSYQPSTQWLLPKEEKFLLNLGESIHESMDEDNVELSIPLDYIWINHIFSRKIHALTPDEGLDLADYNPKKQLRDIKASAWYQKKQMFLAKNPTYCYRVEGDYMGDLFTIAPKTYPDADETTPRVPVCRKIPSCAAAAGRPHTFSEGYYLYMSMEPLITVLPSSSLVFDAPITGERWVIPPKEEVNFICIGTAKEIRGLSPDVAFLEAGIAAHQFAEFGGVPNEIFMDRIFNPSYYDLFEADQENIGVNIIN